jgi:hypothetical protein
MKPTSEEQIERVIPADSADFLDRRPIRYASPLVLKDGTKIDLNKPGPLDDAARGAA